MRSQDSHYHSDTGEALSAQAQLATCFELLWQNVWSDHSGTSQGGVRGHLSLPLEEGAQWV